MTHTFLFLKTLYAKWSEDEVPRHSATIAYYAAFSLPAFTLVVLSIAGRIISPATVQNELFERLRQYTGEAVASLLQTTLEHVQTHRSSTLLESVSVVLLIVAALGVFREVQYALNDILHANARTGTVMHQVRSFLLSFALVVLTAVLLSIAIGVSALLQLMSVRVGAWLGVQIDTLNTINTLVTAGTMFVLFFLLYLVLPAKRMPVVPTLVCALVTSILLLAGTFVLTLYIAHSSIAEVYGVAASVLILLFWIYYSANIFLLGPELIETWMEVTSTKKTMVEKMLRR